MSLPSDVTFNNLSDFYQAILPYLNTGNGGTSDTPLGQVAFFDDVVAPAGWLVADGTVYNISDYPDLANQYERVHGSKNFYGGNGTTTFAVPDLQGEFLRASGTNSHANQGSGGTVGEHQDATVIPNVYGSDKVYESTTAPSNQDKILTTPASHNYANASSVSNPGDAWRDYTTRPTNTSLLLCIKAVPSSEMNTYSTTERIVGTWIDGRHVYARVVPSSVTVSANAVALMSLTGTNIDKIINCRLINDDLVYPCNTAIDRQNNRILVASFNASITITHAILEYVKTSN